MLRDCDSIVDISISQGIDEVILNCELYTIKNGGHEFFGEQFEDAMSHILDYMKIFNDDASWV